jgi:hypothetical protein
MKRQRGIILNLGAAVALFFGVALCGCAPDKTGAPPTEEPVTPPEAAGDSLPFSGFYGFGEFQGQSLMEEGLHLKNVKAADWAGWSKEWKGEPYELRKNNTLIVEVQGPDSFWEGTDAKLMKWSVQWPGMSEDVCLKCSNQGRRSADDPCFVLPLRGRFEYPIPQEALDKGKLTKIGITLMKGATYKDVKIKISFGRK